MGNFAVHRDWTNACTALGFASFVAIVIVGFRLWWLSSHASTRSHRRGPAIVLVTAIVGFLLAITVGAVTYKPDITATAIASNSGAATSTPTTAAEAPAVAPAVPVARRSVAELNHEREWWQTASGVVSAAADRAHGVSIGVAEHPGDQATREYYAVPEKLKETDLDSSKDFHTPLSWDDVHASLLEVVAAVNENVDLLQKSHDGDEDAARSASPQADVVRDKFCKALDLARSHYSAEGGRSNDLSLFYISENGDWPCVLVDDPSPRKGIVIRKTVGIESFEQFTGVGGQSASASDDNIIADLGVRLKPGDRVTVREHRRDFDDGSPPELCRSEVRYGSKQYWLSCRDIKL